MALRVGGGTRSATFENQSEFFRKESTEKWRIRRVRNGARRARPRGERCKAPFIYTKKPPYNKEKRKTQKF